MQLKMMLSETMANDILTNATAINVFYLYGTVFVAVDTAAGRRRWATRRRWFAIDYNNAVQRFGASVGQHFPTDSRR